jgi:Zn-dependent protease with chaperone function
MMVSHAASCGMSRLMEYDADRYEARLAGSKTFAETSKRLHTLYYGAEQFFKSLGRRPVEVTGNFVRDIVNHCGTLDDLDEKRMRRRRKKEKTGWFDTHPSTADRIASANEEDAPGIFRSKLPAEAVFHEFDQLCLSLQRI